LFLYRDVLGIQLGNVQALRAKRPSQLRHAPSKADVRKIITEAKDNGGYPTRLVIKLLYGCGLRVSEPLNLRIKDVCLTESQLIIRGAKGGKDRRVNIPCSLMPEIRQQVERARSMWQMDSANSMPVPLPGRLEVKYPRSAFAWQWYWLFPAHKPCSHPRTKRVVRYRLHEVNVQRCVKAAAIKAGLEGSVTPHHLRHAYATHAMQAGAYVRDIQTVMGHSHLETTMGYLTAETNRVESPLETL
jgi:site-specific recombinase XerD